MKKGFTLVELAIVLVIIGLLVGGVLAGQALIERSQLNKVITQLRGLETGVKTFQAKYGALPGDYKRATAVWGAIAGSCNPGTVAGTGTQTCDGDGDGRVASHSGGQKEYFRFWQHLSNAELLSGSYSGIYNTSCDTSVDCLIPGTNVPAGVHDGSQWYFAFYDLTRNWGAKQVARHFFAYSGNTGTNPGGYNGRWVNEILTPEQQMTIDAKIDDGMPQTGRVVDMNNNVSPNASYTTGCASTDANSPTATYNLANTDKRCLMIIDMM